MADSRAKTAWEKENVIQVKVKINRNQDPELYDLLQQAVSKSGLARDLMKIYAFFQCTVLISKETRLRDPVIISRYINI